MSISIRFFARHFDRPEAPLRLMNESTGSAFQFEEFAKENGIRYWDAHQLMSSLGYETYASFKNVILKAVSSCAKLGIETHEAFIPETLLEEGKSRSTYRLTRFACFLITMHADSSKAQVSAAKVYFATLAEAIMQQCVSSNDLARLELRADLSEGEDVMESAASKAGITNYAFFKSAGFMGMYNMNLKKLKLKKGVAPDATLYDLMGKTELAGNWFRVTQTAERIKSHAVKGQAALEKTARQVGANVRQEMLKNSKVAPENLPIEEDLKHVKKRITDTRKGMDQKKLLP
jgi:DNA-damage-inducible protein D